MSGLESFTGYVVPLFDDGGGVARMVDPFDVSQSLDVGYTSAQVVPVVISSLEIYRLYGVEHWLAMIKDETELRRLEKELGMTMATLSQGELQRWKLRPLDRVTVAKRGPRGIVLDVDGVSNPSDVQNRPEFPFLSLHKGRAQVPIPLMDLATITPETAPGIQEPQLRNLSEGGILLANALSTFAPPLWGSLGVITGPSTGGKTFTWLMVYYLAAWVLIPRMKDLRVVVCDVGERGDEIGELRQIAMGSPRIELFVTEFKEPPDFSISVAEAAGARVQKLLMDGFPVIYILDSGNRIVRAYALGDSKRPSTSGGLSQRGLIETRSGLGVVGTFPEHPRRTNLLGWDGREYESPPVCSLFVTCLTETEDRADEVVHGMLRGTGNSHWPYTNRGGIGEHPMFDYTPLMTRNLNWVDWGDPDWRSFFKVARQKLRLAALAGGRFSPQLATDWVRQTFGAKGVTLQELKRKWMRESWRNELFQTFNMPEGVTGILIVDWELTVDQVKALVDQGLGDQETIKGLSDVGVRREQVLQFLSGEISKDQLLEPLKKWQQSWSNRGYLDALNEHNAQQNRPERQSSLSNTFCDQLRGADISADLMRELLLAGFSTKSITDAVGSGANAGNIREALSQRGNNGSDSQKVEVMMPQEEVGDESAK